MTRYALIVLAALFLASCGVKSDLETPGGNTTPKNEQDPSKPPHPLGQ
jgi:hypothetical protein